MYIYVYNVYFQLPITSRQCNLTIKGTHNIVNAQDLKPWISFKLAYYLIRFTIFTSLPRKIRLLSEKWILQLLQLGINIQFRFNFNNAFQFINC